MAEYKDNIADFSAFIIERHVKNFMIAYRSKGKKEAGYVLKEVPELYKEEIVIRIKQELKL